MTWTIYAHADDPRYLSINDGIHGDTLLHTSEGNLDQARAATFAAWVTESVEALADVRGELASWQRYAEVHGMGAAKTADALIARIDALLVQP